jgi:hypothetical protein
MASRLMNSHAVPRPLLPSQPPAPPTGSDLPSRSPARGSRPRIVGAGPPARGASPGRSAAESRGPARPPRICRLTAEADRPAEAVALSLLGPVSVALAVPVYAHRARLREAGLLLLVGT